MRAPHTHTATRVLVVNQDLSLAEELRRALLAPPVPAGNGTHHPPHHAPAGSNLPVYALECGVDLATALELAHRARADGHPFRVAFVGSLGRSRDVNLEVPLRLWEVIPELHVILCASATDASRAECGSRTLGAERTAVLTRPLDPLQTRELTRLACSGPGRRVTAPAPVPEPLRRPHGANGNHPVKPAYEVLADSVAGGLNRTLAALAETVSRHGNGPGAVGGTLDPRREIVGAVDRAARLVAQLHILGHPGAPPLHPTAVVPLLQVVATRLDHLFDGSLRVEVAGDLPAVSVPGNPAWLEQMLTDLGLLAAQHPPAASVLRLSASLLPAERDHRGQVSLLVECVVPTARRGAGSAGGAPAAPAGVLTGLEWPVAEAVIHAHGGRMRGRGPDGTTTRIDLELPMAPLPAPAAPRPRSTPPVASRVPTIFLVEDDPDIRQVTRLVLEDEGYVVIEAADSAEALRWWEERGSSVDALIVDLVIPGNVDGMTLADQLRGDRPDLKVILTTGFAGEGFATEALASRGMEFLSKPYTDVQVLSLLGRCLGREERRRVSLDAT